MERARTANAPVVWSLSALLALIFLFTGIPKLLGTGTIGLQAASMAGFPHWIRIVVGVIEVAGAIGLLIPAIASLAAVALAILMIPATVTQAMSGEGGVWVPVLVFLLLAYVAWQRSAEAISAGYRSAIATPHPVLREGIIAGLIGATVIAVWFFLVDLIAGHPLFTPATLGAALFSVFGPVPAGESRAVHVAVYTGFHYVAFIVAGIVAALVLRAAGRNPSLLLGFVILFVAFELAFYSLVAILQQATPLGTLAWYQVMVGNLIAALAMGAYLWRAHPALREQLAHALD